MMTRRIGLIVVLAIICTHVSSTMADDRNITSDIILRHSVDDNTCHEKESVVKEMIASYGLEDVYREQMLKFKDLYQSGLYKQAMTDFSLDHWKSVMANSVAGYYDLTAWREINELVKLIKYNPVTDEYKHKPTKSELARMSNATHYMFSKRSKLVAQELGITGILANSEFTKALMTNDQVVEKCIGSSEFPCSIVNIKPFDNYYFTAELLRIDGKLELLPLAYTKAAIRGNPKAQQIIGMFYYNGENTNHDYLLAHTFLTMAKTNGVKAINVNKMFRNTLSPKQIERSKRLAAILVSLKVPDKCAKPDYQLIAAARRRSNYFDFIPENTSGWIIVDERPAKNTSFMLIDNRDAKLRAILRGGISSKGKALKDYIDWGYDKWTQNAVEVFDQGYFKFKGKKAYRLHYSRTLKKSGKLRNTVIYIISHNNHFYRFQINTKSKIDDKKAAINAALNGIYFY